MKDIQYKGYNIELTQIENAPPPHEYDTLLGNMILQHPVFTYSRNSHGYRIQDYGNWDKLKNRIIKDVNPIVILPIYLQKQPTLELKTIKSDNPENCEQIGLIYVNEIQARTWFMVDAEVSLEALIDHATEVINKQIHLYHLWLSNEIYGYLITDSQGNQVDSLWYIFGKNESIRQAQEIIDDILQSKEIDGETTSNKKVKK